MTNIVIAVPTSIITTIALMFGMRWSYNRWIKGWMNSPDSQIGYVVGSKLSSTDFLTAILVGSTVGVTVLVALYSAGL